MYNIKNTLAASILVYSTQSFAETTETEVYEYNSKESTTYYLDNEELDLIMPGLARALARCKSQNNVEREIIIGDNILVFCSESRAYVDLSDFDDLIHFVSFELSAHQQNGLEEDGDGL